MSVVRVQDVVPVPAQRSAVPWLTAAPRLIQNLGICTALASTSEVASIVLDTRSLESTDLSTNLVGLADQGQNAFLDAYSDLLDISNGTQAMTRDDGYFDRLEEAIGKPEGERAANRAMDRIDATIVDCSKNGLRTQKQFRDWNLAVGRVRKAVVETQTSIQADAKEVKEDLIELDNEHALQEVQVNQKVSQVENAQQEYQNILNIHRSREAALRECTDSAITCATLGVTAGMLGAMLGAAGSAALLAFSGSRASSLEAELQRKITEGYQLEMEMQKVRNELSNVRTEEEKLQAAARIICFVCKHLQGLCNDIVKLVTMFNHLNSTIRQLIREHKEAKIIASDIREDLENAEDDGQEARISRRDYKQFRNQVHQMRRFAIMIEAMSSLYADVIADVINPGFSKVVETAIDDPSEASMEVAVVSKERSMNDYLVVAEKMCRSRELDSNARLEKRLADVDAAFEAKKRSKAGRPKFKKEASSGSRSSGSSRRFLSKVFSRN